MSGLPAGALNELLTNGPEAFDKAIADSQAQTQAAMNKPAVADNKYNQSRAEHAALGRYFAERANRDASDKQSPAELQAVKDHAVEKYLREHPGANRRDVEAAFDREHADARAKQQAQQEPKGVAVLSQEATSALDDDAIIRLANIDPGPLPSNLEFDRPALAQYAEFVVNAGIAPRVADQLASWWADIVTSTFGQDDVDFAALEQRLHHDFQGKVSEQHLSALAKWMTALLDEDARG
jgi:hypothetical protein